MKGLWPRWLQQKRPVARYQHRKKLSRQLKLIKLKLTRRSVSLIRRKSRSVKRSSKLQQLRLVMKKKRKPK